MVQFGQHALDWLSHNWPGIPYPYEKTTVVQGIAGHGIPDDGERRELPGHDFSRFVAEHEIAHTYLPFYMGINETRYAFMDEGFATFFEFLIGSADLGRDRAMEFFKQFRVTAGSRSSPGEDLPIITPEDMLKGVA